MLRFRRKTVMYYQGIRKCMLCPDTSQSHAVFVFHFYSSNTTGVLSDIQSSACFFFCLGTDISATVDLRGQEVKGQGHRRRKLYLKAWRRHHSRSLESSREGHAVRDGNVALEKGERCVARSCYCPHVCPICVLLTHL